MPNFFFHLENDITLEIAKKLNSHEVKELIPSIGKRKLFTEAVLSLNEESYLLVCIFQLLRISLKNNILIPSDFKFYTFNKLICILNFWFLEFTINS